VTIYSCNILLWNAPDVHFEVTCSKGTYIRSLAHDLGAALECGGCLTQLRRTKIGNVDLAESFTVVEVQEMFHMDKAAEPQGPNQ
jgi:tRNA pseudouridine55 synthase